MDVNTNIVDTKEVIKTEIVNQLDNIKKMLINDKKEYSNIEEIKINKPHNRIIFGAPGTGKSYKINKEIKENNLKELSKREVCNNFTSNERTVLDKRMVPKAYISNHIKQEYKKK